MRWMLILLVWVAGACSGKTTPNQSDGGVTNSTNPSGGQSSGSGGISAQNGGAGPATSAAGGQSASAGGATSGTSQPVETGGSNGTGGSTPLVPCSVDASATTYHSLASGTFAGADLNGFVCTGGADVYLEKTQASSYVGSQYLVVMNSSVSSASGSSFSFVMPADATGADLTIMAGVGSPTPGTYSIDNATSCGDLAFCVYLPLPATVHCPDDAGVCDSRYCAMQGPVSGPTCQPVTPETCYTAQGTSSCLPGAESQVGSWTLTLASVTPYVSDAGSSGMSYYIVHGSFTATMVEDSASPDAGVVTANLSLYF